jgi:hypothetical protein
MNQLQNVQRWRSQPLLLQGVAAPHYQRYARRARTVCNSAWITLGLDCSNSTLLPVFALTDSNCCCIHGLQVGSTNTESVCGITCYVSDTPGFRGILKQVRRCAALACFGQHVRLALTAPHQHRCLRSVSASRILTPHTHPHMRTPPHARTYTHTRTRTPISMCSGMKTFM